MLSANMDTQTSRRGEHIIAEITFIVHDVTVEAVGAMLVLWDNLWIFQFISEWTALNHRTDRFYGLLEV